jgi:GNAT superfamily N-acetyltransferase
VPDCDWLLLATSKRTSNTDRDAARAGLRVELLTREHDRGGFTSGSPQLDQYLKHVAGQDSRRDLATVFVLIEGQSAVVVGYYSLSSYAVLIADLPRDVQKRVGRYPLVPATLMGRLAVDAAHHGQGLGELLLIDALRRAAGATLSVASVGVIVDAIDATAESFYRHFDFQPVAGASNRLLLPMATIRALESPT